jgi:hypothetical protein
VEKFKAFLMGAMEIFNVSKQESLSISRKIFLVNHMCGSTLIGTHQDTSIRSVKDFTKILRSLFTIFRVDSISFWSEMWLIG